MTLVVFKVFYMGKVVRNGGHVVFETFIIPLIIYHLLLAHIMILICLFLIHILLL